ncbi:MAG: ornithine carbamoyltransferase [Hyphomicrobiaceae bacterium]
MSVRHFLDIHDLDRVTLRSILDSAHAMKRAGRRVPEDLKPKDIDTRILLMIFERPSTRTRVSFDVAMRQLGGQTISLNHSDLQLGRGETIADTAKVLSRYGDAIMLRTRDHETLVELATHAEIPVINGLSDQSHPCQVIADIMTLEEHGGPVSKRIVAWVGDGNNVAASWIHAAARLDFTLRLACPAQLRPPAEIVAWAKDQGASIDLVDDPDDAVAGVDCVVTDTWVSMGQNDEGRRKQLLGPYAVGSELMKRAKPSAVFMHCLPAYRGHEVSAEVIDGPQSVVWDEAENRLHAQKAILAWCLG